MSRSAFATLVGVLVLGAAPPLAMANPANDAKVHTGDFSISFNDDESD